MDVIMDEMLLRLCAGCVMNNLGSPDIGETLPKFLTAEISLEILAIGKKNPILHLLFLQVDEKNRRKKCLC